MNELHLETSPYLLQHANNPIHWKAWNEKALATAREQNKLIIVSVGYSACHWCHVMEHESFEDNEVAAVMNGHFVSIKVDREERPDVDATYMKAVQLMTGQGGWPMNAILLPDGRPVWGGTYFRKNNWIDSLQQLQELYASSPEKVIDYAEKLMQGIQAMSLIQKQEVSEIPDTAALKPIVQKWARSFDHEFGGYTRAPKFMMPDNYIFLQRYGYQTQSQELLDFTDLTLTRMAWGGLFDTVDGGFSRYSVDMKWHVPHFEKMLYDNGQLMTLYAEAYKRTQKPLYKEVIEKTHRFIAKELTLSNGAFYSALDADSLDNEGHLEEGAFYAWEKDELKELLKDDFELFADVFNVNEFGFWEHKKYVLIQNEPLEEIAKKWNIDTNELHSKKEQWEQLLYNVREKRSKPRLDDKTITSWNALMLKGYVDCYKALGNKEYLDAAHNNAVFITGNLWDSNGQLYRTYKNGTAHINGFLEDYAITANAFIALYQATLEEKWLLYAKQLTDYCLENFYDQSEQFFSYTSLKDEKLIALHFETEDNVISSSNSVMANVLYKLGILFNNSHYEKTALQMLQHITANLDYPSAFSNWLNLWMDLSDDNRELAICGQDAVGQVTKINAQYIPYVLIAGCTAPSSIPFLQDRFAANNLLFYVCKNKTCNLPVTDYGQALDHLKIVTDNG